MAKVGVVLSGCGVYDGAEIHESVATLLALDRADAEVVFMAPDIDQMHVINHIKGAPEEGETRNVRIEAGRIARGEVNIVNEVKASDIDALIFPGGFGAAKNLSDVLDCSVLVAIASRPCWVASSIFPPRCSWNPSLVISLTSFRLNGSGRRIPNSCP